MSRSERIVKQLGMSQGAAANKLRKKILFSFVKKLKEDICFKCGKEIESVEELSIEHKQPWENRSADLFWDLDNIAFSHMRCNRQHEQGAVKLRKVGPEGTSWCYKCKVFKSRDAFSPCKSYWNGLDRECKDCKNDRNVLRDRTDGAWEPKIERILLDSSNDKTQVS